jgi:hypothetical protein
MTDNVKMELLTVDSPPDWDVGVLCSLRIKRLRVPAFPAPEVHGVAVRPRIDRVADGTLGLPRKNDPFAVIARESAALGVHVLFTTDLSTARTTPANGHRFSMPIIADENLFA